MLTNETIIPHKSNHPFSDDIPQLLIEHREHLAGSALAMEVILERGYKSILGASGLKDLGFSKVQRRRSGILIPLCSVEGTVFSYQYKPDRPRTNNRDKPIKYENPIGSRIRIDVPPRCREKLGDPDEPLFITEGIKKVDSLATMGVCAICLTGVWNFKGTNDLGGNTLLADWDYITLKNRIVYIVFDSDVTTKPQVKKALDRLSEHLKRKGAKVRILQLPDGPEGQKVGVDDYFAASHDLDDLIACEAMDEIKVVEEARFINDTQYRVENNVLCWEQITREGGKNLIPLCTFDAWISEYIIKDNGQDLSSFYRINGRNHKGKTLPTIDVRTEEFSSLKWVTPNWGLNAIVNPGQNIPGRIVHALQVRSQNAPEKRVYEHIGWREIDGDQVYLSGGVSIGPDGPVDVDVELESPLRGYVFLRPEGDPVEAFKISHSFLYIGELSITLPLWTTMYLAPLSSMIDTSFSVWLVAKSGSFKSVISALALCHYGTFDHLSIPAGWSSTKNSLEKMLFEAKDAPFLIDDLHPGQDKNDSRRLAQTAADVIRSQGNRQGRERMRGDRGLEGEYRPRGMFISSGEHAPGGHSENSRIIVVNMTKWDIDQQNLTAAQDENHAYYYNRSMSHYIQWLSKNYATLESEFKKVWREKRNSLYDSEKHARLSSDIASLCTGIYAATKFGMEIGAMTEKEAASLRIGSEKLFKDLVDEQSQTVESYRPTHRFINSLTSLFSQGRVNLMNVTATSKPSTEAGIPNIGWHDGNGTLFLDPETTWIEVYKFCESAGQPLTISKEGLFKDLKDEGYTIDHVKGRTTASKHITAFGCQKRVLKIKRRVFDVALDADDDKFSEVLL